MLKRKDRRIKACTNPSCRRCKKHYKYQADENYCSVCKSELEYVCAKCGGKLEDIDRKHKVCFKCIEKQRKNAETRKEVATGLITIAGAIGNVVAEKITKTSKSGKFSKSGKTPKFTINMKQDKEGSKPDNID